MPRCFETISVPVNIKEQKMYMNVPCGKCLNCCKNKQSEWSFRLSEELKISNSAHFITITYDDQYLSYTDDGEETLDKKDIRDWLKRLRWEQNKKAPEDWPKIRYYLVGEYGDNTKRPHYHAIMFNLYPEGLQERLIKTWSMGYVDIGNCTPASIHYTTGYIQNRYIDLDGPEQPFAVMSRKPALGSAYLQRTKDYHKKGQIFYAVKDGFKQNLPRIYRDKIFTEEEKYNHSKEMGLIVDRKNTREIERLQNLGNDIDIYRENQYKQAVDNHNRKSKNKAKL